MPARRQDLMVIYKKKKKTKKEKEYLLNSGLCRPERPQFKNQRKRKERKVPRPCLRTKKVMEHECDGDTNYNWCPRNGPQNLGMRAETVGSRG